MNTTWAIDEYGKPTKCKAKPENIGKGRCNHKFHSKEGESVDKFLERVQKEQEQVVVTEDYDDYELQNLSFDRRQELISEGNHLDYFVKSPWVEDRIELIKQDKCLDELVDDDSYEVRRELARKGLHLDRLIEDKDIRVREEAIVRAIHFDRDDLVKSFVEKDDIDNLKIKRKLACVYHGKYAKLLLDDDDETVRTNTKRTLGLE